ncbi:MAG: aminotransferase class V-fold PLP-dependent enzyme [Thermomicrobiales bacterium]|nr:aminotransferase class V-fold PLP-dependent enzyme [Thermomicrobiales bacterium]
MSAASRIRDLNPVINLSGPLTMYGSSISSAGVAAATAEALRHHWDMDALNRLAGEVIAEWSGAESGMVTSSSASGVALAVAATMTGADLGRIAQLPDTSGMKNEVVIQKEHAVNFGAPIEQMIRLAGATVREVGSVNQTTPALIQHALNDRTAATMFVISHHTVQYGFVQLDEFVRLSHAAGVPVIVDAAAQDQQIERIVQSGADLIILSVQKYLSGPTAGIVCGSRALVRAVDLQSAGIGRAMKVGKEGLFGTIAALEERMQSNLGEWESGQRGKAEYLASRLGDLRGVGISVERDKVGQPVHRVRLEVDRERAGLSAEEICAALIACTPSIKPRAHHTDEGWFLLEPVHITEQEMDVVAQELARIVG